MESQDLITIYHGSSNIINKPKYGVGKTYNDYGLGFYTTTSEHLAGEWAVLITGKSGYINKYSLNLDGLKILYLKNLPILTTISLLLSNRGGSFSNVNLKRRKKLIEKYNIDLNLYDVIIGWRADDSFFDYVTQFLNAELSLEKFEEAMHLGNLGEQICLKSEQSFNKIQFISNSYAPAKKYLDKAISRDRNARNVFTQLENADSGTLILDLIER